MSVNLCRACPVAQINCQHLRAGLEKKVSTPITVRFATGRVEVWDDAPPTIDFKQAACAAKTMPIQSPRDCSGCPIRLPNVIPQNAIQVAHRTKQNAPAVTVAAQAPMMEAQSSSVIAQAQAAVAQAPAQSRAQKITSPAAQPVTAAPAPVVAQAPAQSASIDVGAANDLIARARATAARKAEEKQQRELERVALEQQAAYNTQPEPKPKIIQLQEWLAGQVNKKQSGGAINASAINRRQATPTRMACPTLSMPRSVCRAPAPIKRSLITNAVSVGPIQLLLESCHKFNISIPIRSSRILPLPTLLSCLLPPRQFTLAASMRSQTCGRNRRQRRHRAADRASFEESPGSTGGSGRRVWKMSSNGTSISFRDNRSAPGFKPFNALGNRPNPPVITGVFVAGLANPDFLVEMDAIAVVI